VESLTLDGLPIEDLDLDFRLPGTTIDLKVWYFDSFVFYPNCGIVIYIYIETWFPFT
jgi:hypothetical protein